MTDLATGFERLRTALRPKEDGDGRIGTHGPDCYSWGRGHYECALAEIGRLRADAAPQQRVPLSDEQIDAIPFDGFTDQSVRPWSEAECLRHFARAVERAHGITGEPT